MPVTPACAITDSKVQGATYDNRKSVSDGDINANILYWSSIKCKMVTRSVSASGLYAPHGFDIASVIKATLTKILKP